MSEKTYTSIEVRNWSELTTILRMFAGNWVFRGMRNATYELKSSLERKFFQENPKDNLLSIVQMEELIYNAFKRRSDHFFEQNEKPSSLQESLSLMQHNGIPTRLVDWTKSPYIATYFAVRNNSGRDAAIWAINIDDCLINSKIHMLESINSNRTKMKDIRYNNDDPYKNNLEDIAKKLKDDIEIQKKYQDVPHSDRYENLKYEITIDYITKFIFNNVKYIKESSWGIISVYPEKLNKRMLTQQAIFLCPVDIRVSFLENIKGMYCRLDSCGFKNTSPIIKITIPNNIFRDIARELDRFNINGYSLFPDKTGLSDWFTENFIPNKINSAYPYRPSPPAYNLTDKINKFTKSVIHMDIRIPNQVSFIADILNIFKNWDINIEHFTFIAIDQYIDRLMVDGSIPWGEESFINKTDEKMRIKNNIDMFDNTVESGLKMRGHLDDKSSHKTYKDTWYSIKEPLSNGSSIKHLISKVSNDGISLVDEFCYRVVTDYIRFIIKEELRLMTCGSMDKKSCIHYVKCNEKYCTNKDKDNICNFTFNRTKKDISLHESKSCGTKKRKLCS